MYGILGELMPFQSPITVQKALENIHERRYLLPSIQREFVWSTDQIERLFDSLLRGYPIGSFLFWEVKREHAKDYQFYEFIRTFHARDSRHNPKADLTGSEGLTAILDGQQRLTALYIGLRGTYASKMLHKRWSADESFPTRRLYLNLLTPLDTFDKRYDFRFLTEAASQAPEFGAHWFPVHKVLDFTGPKDIHSYLVKNHLMETDFPGTCLFELHEAVTKKLLITAFNEEEQDLDKVLDIFIRVNSGGTPLSYSDLLLSIATAQWKTRDARENIHALVDELNRIGQGFAFDKDFVLKACLVLAGIQDIRFKVANFNGKNMEIIEAQWPRIAKALRLAVSLVASFGFNHFTLTSNNAVIPIALYLLKRDLPTNFIEAQAHHADRQLIRHWLIVGLTKGLFGAQGDMVLNVLRSAIEESQELFPVEGISSRLLRINRSPRFEREEIEELLAGKYGQRQTFSTLALLYPSLDLRNLFHQDHIHAQSLFTKKKLVANGVPEESVGVFRELADLVPNLQLLEGVPNEEKSSQLFENWIEKKCPDEDERRRFRQLHFIPDEPLSLAGFEVFFRERRNMMMDRLSEILAPSDRHSGARNIAGHR